MLLHVSFEACRPRFGLNTKPVVFLVIGNSYLRYLIPLNSSKENFQYNPINTTVINHLLTKFIYGYCSLE